MVRPCIPPDAGLYLYGLNDLISFATFRPDKSTLLPSPAPERACPVLCFLRDGIVPKRKNWRP